MIRYYLQTDLLTELKQWGIKMLQTTQNTSFRSCGCVKKSIEKMIKQVCFNTLKNDIFGMVSSTTQVWQLTTGSRGEAAFRPLSPGLTGEYEEKISAYYHVRIKHVSFYNIYFSINLSMGKPKVCCRQRETGTFFWQGLVTPLTAKF